MTLVNKFPQRTDKLALCDSSVGPTSPAHPTIPLYPHYCAVLKPRGGWWQQWVATTAYAQGFRNNVKVAFAVAHPGPATVVAETIRFASPKLAALYMHTPDLVGACPSPILPIDGGRACSSRANFVQVGTQKRRVEQRERGLPGRSIGFLWSRGSTIVSVNVSGVRLTDARARQIALLAHPR